jgi:hypothetical protein
VELVLFFPLVFLLGALRKVLFPQLIVEIGRSAEIAARAHALRNFVFVTVILTLILGIVASVVASFIYPPH